MRLLVVGSRKLFGLDRCIFSGNAGSEQVSKNRDKASFRWRRSSLDVPFRIIVRHNNTRSSQYSICTLRAFLLLVLPSAVNLLSFRLVLAMNAVIVSRTSFASYCMKPIPDELSLS